MNKHLVAGALLVVHAALVVVLMATLDRTADETSYLGAGHAILASGWEHEITRLHGPLPILANQIFATEFPAEWFELRTIDPGVIFRGRLGMLPFALIAGLVTYAWSTRLYGVGGGILSLALFVSSPLMLGYGGLLTVDMAYTAGVLGVLFLTARYFDRPTLARAALVGVGLGLACATKYLALFCVPVVLAAVGVAALRGTAGRSRVGSALAAVALAASIALVSLHACYGFTVGLGSGDPGAYQSATLASLVDTPVVGEVVTLLPEPYLLGADFQLAVGAGSHRPYLEGRIAAGHPDYYLWVFLRKTPEWLMAVFALALGLGVRRWFSGARRQAVRGEYVALALLGTTAVGLLIYLSFLTDLQLGVRYVLPLYPFAFVLCGSLAPWSAQGMARWRHARLVLGAVLVLLAVRDAASVWPNLISYYNPSSGGLRAGWRHFSDSNTDWGQALLPGRRQLQADPEVEILTRGGGPRFGQLAIELIELCRADPEAPERARHWIHAFEAHSNLGGAWWIYDVTAEAWEAFLADGGDERSRAELVVAYLGAAQRDGGIIDPGPLEAAERHLDALSPERGAPLRGLANDLRAFAELDEAGAFALVETWTALGRYDRAEAALRDHPRLAEHPRRDEFLVHALARQYRIDEALDLAEQGDPSGSLASILLLSDLHRRSSGSRAAVAVLDRWAPTLTGPDAERARDARAALDALREREDALRRMVEGS